MTRSNFLIGGGETLVGNVTALSGSGDKAHPYTFDESVDRLAPQIQHTLAVVDDLPDGACPGDEAVVGVTLHPSYLAKSWHPAPLFKSLGLRQVGSRETRVDPEVSVRKDPVRVTTELFVAGSRENLHLLDPARQPDPSEVFQEQFCRIETVAPLGRERLKGPRLTGQNIPLEVVLHLGEENGGDSLVLSGFEEWCEKIGVEVIEDRMIGALAFINARADEDELDDLARFSFLRVARRMPKLAFRAIGARAGVSGQSFAVPMPFPQAQSTGPRIAILDGGLPSNHPYGALAIPRTPPNIGAPDPLGLEHGMQVTSAALVGPLRQGETPGQPFAAVDHWRVCDDAGDDFDLTRVLDRIVHILETEQYDAVNLSLGPEIAIDDDDIHPWTVTLDTVAARNETLIISAAGNNGEDDAPSGLNRVQPCSDGVNVLAIGACDHDEDGWSRASYSAMGPGRSPGFVKPDCVAMGGTHAAPFYAISAPGTASGTTGTSFSAPTVLRLAGGIKATFDRLTPTSIRALLLHTADHAKHDRDEVGWGRVRHDLGDIITCADDQATVIYQGTLGVQSMRRYPIPCPDQGFDKRPIITATFVIASPIDPEDAGSYTRSGAQIIFRPETVSDPGVTDKGNPRLHKTKPFFSSGQAFQTEQDLRDDAQRWESVKRATRTFNPGTLDQPVFDIQHHARAHGGAGKRPSDIPYALIVTLHEKGNADLYNTILQQYATLRAMVPGIQVPGR